MTQDKKCKVVLLPSKNGSKIGFNPKRLAKSKYYFYEHGAVNAEAQHLYILSDEEIKEGDWLKFYVFSIFYIS